MVKIYYSNITPKLEVEKYLGHKIGCLISYYKLKKIPKFNFCDSLFLDSGAFSAYTQKVKIDLKAYCRFLHRNKDLIDIYASLDVIGDPEKSYENYLFMLNEGLDPLPCFHYGEPKKYLDLYLKHTDFVALGGLALENRNNRARWLNNVFNRRHEIKFHGFGIGAPFYINRYPWYSIDSSKWAVMARNGSIYTRWGYIGLGCSLGLSESYWKKSGNSVRKKIINYIKTLVFTIEELGKNNSEAVNNRSIINIMYFEELVENCIPNFKPRKGFFR